MSSMYEDEGNWFHQDQESCWRIFQSSPVDVELVENSSETGEE